MFWSGLRFACETSHFVLGKDGGGVEWGVTACVVLMTELE